MGFTDLLLGCFEKDAGLTLRQCQAAGCAIGALALDRAAAVRNR
jgi:hypothetical protein